MDNDGSFTETETQKLCTAERLINEVATDCQYPIFATDKKIHRVNYY